MRDYAKASAKFWTGGTGKLLRKLGAETQVVAFYLFTCPNSNMIGLYHLHIATLSAETGRPLEGACKALRSLAGVHFAYYDEDSEHVWVPNMARFQIGDRLKKRDNRHVAVVRELEQVRNTPFFNEFVLRYRDAFELHDLELNTIPVAPSKAPSKDLTKPLRSQDQDHEQEQEQECEGLRSGSDAPLSGTPRDSEGSTGTAAAVIAEATAQMTAAGAMATALRALNVRVGSLDPVLMAWIADGYTTEQLVETVKVIRMTKGDNEVVYPKYIDAKLRDAGRAKSAAPAAITHQQRESAELQKLKDRRPAIGLAGFRDPLANETVNDYRKAQDAEWHRKQDASSKTPLQVAVAGAAAALKAQP